MRLLNTSTLAMEEFMDEKELRYAILSHTWGEDELTFNDMLKLSSRPVRADDHANGDQTWYSACRAKAGYTKISNAAMVAAGMGYEHIWIDTCCIDKSSSAELSEAINSMYRWYKKAGVCIAYLTDVSVAEDDDMGENTEGHKANTIEFRTSRWFTRGWTLQELLAPRELRFFSKDWIHLADKSSIAGVLSVITGINEHILSGAADISLTSVARRMSWASTRSTTRLEDMAYCLLGLFDVNMPLLYGEGEKAFQRLQEEITKRSDDHTVFAWRHKLPKDQWNMGFCLYRGLFARSPSEFAAFPGYYASNAVEGGPSFTHPSTITNIGLQTKLPLIPVAEAKSLQTYPPVDTSDAENEFLAVLSYRDPRRYAIQLKKLIAEQPVYVRVRPDIIYLVKDDKDDSIETPPAREVIIQQTPRIYKPHLSLRLAGFAGLLQGPSFHAPFTVAMRRPGLAPRVLEGPARLSAAVWARPDRGPGLFGTIVRTSSSTGMSVVFAFGIDPASTLPTVCVYFSGQGEDSAGFSMEESKERALIHGPGNVLSQGLLWDSTTASVVDENGLVEEFKLSVSTAVRREKDILLCGVKIVSSGPKARE